MIIIIKESVDPIYIDFYYKLELRHCRGYELNSISQFYDRLFERGG
jgi:hypothetical protein